MKVEIKIDALNPKLDSLIEKGLEEAGLPSCLGNMIPPIMVRMIEVEDAEFFSNRNTISPQEIGMEDTSKLVRLPMTNTNMVLTIEGLKKLQEYKESRAKVYIEHIKKCSNCDKVDLCYKLTTNYLKMISLELNNQRKGEVL